MALITTGSINDFNIQPLPFTKLEGLQKEKTAEKLYQKGIEVSQLKNISTISELNEISRVIPGESFQFATSEEPRGVALKSVELTKNFDTFLRGIFNPANEIYFVAWAWDLSGEAVYQYPGEGFNAQDLVFKIKAGSIREFIGQGINLFPKREVTGGIALRIQIWESDEEIRQFGKVLSEVADSIQKSKLNNLLSLIASGLGAPGATVSLVKDAALELAGIISTILKANSNDYVDFFEGYYAADQQWTAGEDMYAGNSSVLTLDKY